MNTEDRIMTLLLGLNRVFPNTSLRKESMIMYAYLLKEIEFDVLKSAIEEIMRTFREYPKPVDIIECVNHLSSQQLIDEILICLQLALLNSLYYHFFPLLSINLLILVGVFNTIFRNGFVTPAYR